MPGNLVGIRLTIERHGCKVENMALNAKVANEHLLRMANPGSSPR